MIQKKLISTPFVADQYTQRRFDFNMLGRTDTFFDYKDGESLTWSIGVSDIVDSDATKFADVESHNAWSLLDGTPPLVIPCSHLPFEADFTFARPYSTTVLGVYSELQWRVQLPDKTTVLAPTSPARGLAAFGNSVHLLTLRLVLDQENYWTLDKPRDLSLAETPVAHAFASLECSQVRSYFTQDGREINACEAWVLERAGADAPRVSPLAGKGGDGGLRYSLAKIKGKLRAALVIAEPTNTGAPVVGACVLTPEKDNEVQVARLTVGLDKKQNLILKAIDEPDLDKPTGAARILVLTVDHSSIADVRSVKLELIYTTPTAEPDNTSVVASTFGDALYAFFHDLPVRKCGSAVKVIATLDVGGTLRTSAAVELG